MSEWKTIRTDEFVSSENRAFEEIQTSQAMTIENTVQGL